MRYCLAVLLLFAVLPGMNVLAAPVPAPYAILDIGPPPKGETADQYRKDQIEGQTDHASLTLTWADAEVRKLPSVAAMKDARPWLAKNLRVTVEEGGRRLRFTFLAGTRAERVTIINAFLRASLYGRKGSLKWGEECLRMYEKCILDLEKRIKSERDLNWVDTYQKGIDELRSVRIPELRAEIARFKQYAVIKWAK